MFTFGLIGPSGFGQFLIRTLQELPTVRLGAIAARNEDTLKDLSNRYGIPKYYTRYHDMLADPDIDGVFIVTPPYLHFPMTRDALRAGKHVIVEKPPSLTINEVEELVTLAKTKRLQVSADFEMRYSPILKMLDDIVKSKVLGDVKLVEFTNLAGGYNLPEWFWDDSKSGGIFVEHGVHFFDIYQQIFGNAHHLYSKIYKSGPGVGQRAQAVIEFPGGVYGTFNHLFDRIDPLAHTFARIVFERAVLTLEGWIPLQITGNALLEQDRITSLRRILPSEALRAIEAYGGDPFRKDGAEFHPMLMSVHYKSAYDKEAMFQKMIQDLVSEFIIAADNKTVHKTNLETTLESLRLALECTKKAETA